MEKKRMVEARRLLGSSLLTDDPSDLFEMSEVYALLTTLEKGIEQQKKRLRLRLLSAIESEGTPTKNGQEVVLPGGIVVTRTRRQDALPDIDRLAELAESSGLQVEDVVDLVQKAVPSMSKIETLITLGRLDREKVEELRSVTWALAAKLPKDTVALLESGVKG